MTTITGRITDAEGTALEGVQVTVQLRPRPAFVTATGVELAPMIAVITDSNGDYSLDLTPTADITPADSYYEIIERIPDQYGGPTKHVIQVGALSATVYSSLVSSPPANTTETFLTQAAGDARYVLAPASFGASGDLAVSRPNDTADGGALSSFSRTDHRHDREITYGTAAARAALAGDDLFEGLRFRETDGSDKLYEYRGSTWLQRQDVLVVADATARDAIANPYIGMRVLLADNGLRQWYDGSGWYLEGEQVIHRTVTTGAVSTMSSGTLPVIPNGWALRIEFEGSLLAGAGIDLYFRLNGDSGANYHRQFLLATNATVTAAAGGGATQFIPSSVSAHSANRWQQAEVYLPNYLQTARHKIMQARGYDSRDETNPMIISAGGRWASTAAVTSVSFTIPSSTFTVGTSMTVYARSTKG